MSLAKGITARYTKCDTRGQSSDGKAKDWFEGPNLAGLISGVFSWVQMTSEDVSTSLLQRRGIDEPATGRGMGEQRQRIRRARVR